MADPPSRPCGRGRCRRRPPPSFRCGTGRTASRSCCSGATAEACSAACGSSREARWIGRSATGGGAEADEMAAARRAAVREAQEEAGLELDEERAGDLVVLAAAAGGAPSVSPPGSSWRRPGITCRWSSTTARSTSTAGWRRRRPWRRATPGDRAGAADVHHPVVAVAASRRGGRAGRRCGPRPGAVHDAGSCSVRTAGCEPPSGPATPAMRDGDIDRPGPRRRLWLDPDGWRVEITESSLRRRGPARPLRLDPIAEARRQWQDHGWVEAADGMAAVTSVFRAQQIYLARIDAVLRPLGLTFARYEVLMLLLFSRAGALPLNKVGRPAAGAPDQHHQRRQPVGGAGAHHPGAPPD